MEYAAAQLNSEVPIEHPRMAPVYGSTSFVERRIESRRVRSGHTSEPRSHARSIAALAIVTSNLVAATWPRFRTHTGTELPRRFMVREP